MLLLLWGGRHQFQRAAVPASGSGASPSAQPGVLKVNQLTATSAPVKAPESSTGGRQATMFPSGNKSESKSKPIVNPNADGPNGKVAMAVPNTAQADGAAVSPAIVEAVRSHSNGSASLHVKDRNEGGAYTHPVYILFVDTFLFLVLAVVSIDESLVRGSTLGGISCTGLVDWETTSVLLA